MAKGRRDKLAQVADAISDRGSVGWDLELAAAPGSLVPALKRLRQLDGLANAFRHVAASHPESREVDSGSPTAPIRPAPLFLWGHLEVHARIGQGSFGDVHLAIDPQLDRRVALKLWRSGAVAADGSPRRFLDEARRLARVCHPNVVLVHGAGVHRRRAGFWTELIAGETLAARLATRGPLAPEEATRIGLDLSRALGAVHAAGLVHGDVKAENVMQDENGRTVLMDFGAASRLDPPKGELPASTFLTPYAAAPEILEGAAPRPSADVYSLGVLLYRLVSGEYPVTGQSLAELREMHRRGGARPLRELRPDLPPDLLGVVDRAMARQAADRFQSAGDLEGALRGALRSQSTTARLGGAQTLRTLLVDVGRAPEQLCRRIARDAALALRPFHDVGRSQGRLDMDSVRVLADGGVELESRAEPSQPGASPREDIRALGAILSELATGEAVSPALPGRRVGDVRSQLSSFFEEVVSVLLGNDSEFSLSARQLADVLDQGERSAWWRSRARALRLSTKKPLRRIRIPRETALHGRGPQLEELLAIWERAKLGQGQVALIVGEAGIGKSRLVDDFVGRLGDEGEDLHFLFGAFPPGGAALTLGAYADAYREQLGEGRIQETLSQYLPDSPFLVSALSALLQGEPTGNDRFTKETLHSAFVQLTRALSSELPTIVVIDDLHFAPEEGLSLFAALAAAAAGQPLLLVGATRPELPVAWVAEIARSEHGRTISPSRLALDDVAELLTEILGDAPLSPLFTEELVARSDGNPYFLLEIVRALKSRAGSSTEQGVALGAASLRGVGIPFSIEQMVAARMAGLETEDDRELLDLACCAGFRFDPCLVAEAAGMELVRALRRFGRIEVRHGVVRATGPDYVFDHHQVQEFLYAALSDPLKQHYHSAIAAAMRARAGVEGEPMVSICSHELRGKEPGRALPLLTPALEYLEARYANAAAIALTDHALGVPGLLSGADRARILLRRAARLPFLGRRVEAEAALEEALTLIDSDSVPELAAEIERRLGVEYRLAGDFDRATRSLQQSIRHSASVPDPRGEGAATRELATVLFHTGRPTEAELQYERSIELSSRGGDRRELCLAKSDLGNLLVDAGRFTQAESLIRASLAEARELGSVEVELSVLATLGAMLLDQGRAEDALETSTRLLQLSREIGLRGGESLAWVNLASALFALGRFGEARTRLEQVVRSAPELRTRNHEAYARCNLGLLFGVIGDLERATESFDAATALCTEFGFVWLRADLLYFRGSVAEMHGDPSGAASFLREALETFRATEKPLGVARTLTLLARLAAADGRVEEARAQLREATGIAADSSEIPESIHAAVEVALLGDGDLPEAVTRFEREEMRLAYSERLRIRFRVFLATGDRRHLDAARGLLRAVLAAVPEADRPRTIEAVPLYRAIERAASQP